VKPLGEVASDGLDERANAAATRGPFSRFLSALSRENGGRSDKEERQSETACLLIDSETEKLRKILSRNEDEKFFCRAHTHKREARQASQPASAFYPLQFSSTLFIMCPRRRIEQTKNVARRAMKHPNPVHRKDDCGFCSASKRFAHARNRRS